MISASVLGLVLLVGGGLLVNCQYIQDGDLPFVANNDEDDQTINDKLNEIEHLIRGAYQPDLQAISSYGGQLWSGNRDERSRLLERIANGLARGASKLEPDQLRAMTYMINDDERPQRALDSLDPNQMLRYEVDNLTPAANPPDDLANSDLSEPVNKPEEFEAGYLADVPSSNTADADDWQHFLMNILNQTARDEYELAPSESPEQLTATTLQDADNQISQREVGRLVERLQQWMEASKKVLQDKQQQQQQQQQQQRDNSEDQLEDVDGGRNPATYSGSEYIDQPLALVGHQFVQGGAGEGRQLLGPEGTYENVQVIKTDAAIPSYCDPPNPCPLGYTAKDGCLEEFVNSASFSREYQAQQKCSCDNEHSLFNCAASISSSQRDSSQQQQQQQKQDSSAEESKEGSFLNLGAKLDTLARTVQNRFGNLAFVQRIIGKQQQKQEQDSIQMDNDDSNSNYLVRSARKLSALDMHHKVDLD